jgi:small subunit ribosomal protein S2
MKKLVAKEADGELEKMPKKEASILRKELGKLKSTLGGIANMNKLPAAVVIIDIDREHIAVKEAVKLGIPVVALVDSNCDPEPVDYVIPGNDDALRSIKVIVDALQNAVQEGASVASKKRNQAKAEAAEKAAVAEKAEAEAEA